jgi:hypothetical protein
MNSKITIRHIFLRLYFKKLSLIGTMTSEPILIDMEGREFGLIEELIVIFIG